MEWLLVDQRCHLWLRVVSSGYQDFIPRGWTPYIMALNSPSNASASGCISSILPRNSAQCKKLYVAHARYSRCPGAWLLDFEHEAWIDGIRVGHPQSEVGTFLSLLLCEADLPERVVILYLSHQYEPARPVLQRKGVSTESGFTCFRWDRIALRKYPSTIQHLFGRTSTRSV